jgi:hypothetical protein
MIVLFLTGIASASDEPGAKGPYLFGEGLYLEHALGEPLRALSLYAQAIDDPETSPPLRERGRYRIGRCWEALGENGKAAEAYRELVLQEEQEHSPYPEQALERLEQLRPDWFSSGSAGEKEWRLNRREIERRRHEWLEWLQHSRAEPFLSQGKVEGWILRELPGDDFFGLRPYDTVRKIDGRPIQAASIPALVEEIRTHLSSDRWVIEVERFSPQKGEPILLTLTYHLLAPLEMIERSYEREKADD